MFSQGSVTEAMMEAKKLQCPLVLFVVDEETISTVVEWSVCASYASTAVIQLIRDKSTEHMQLDAVVPERMVPRVHVIPPSVSGLHPSCLYDMGFNYKTVTDVITSASLWENDNVFDRLASSVEETCKALEDEAAQWRRVQGSQNATMVVKQETETREPRITLKFYPNFTRDESHSASSSAAVRVVARSLLWKTATELVKQHLGEEVDKVLLKAKKNEITVSDEEISAAKNVKDGMFYVENGKARAMTEAESQNLFLIAGSVVHVVLNDEYSKTVENLIPSYTAIMALKNEEKEKSSNFSSNCNPQSSLSRSSDDNDINRNCLNLPSADSTAEAVSTTAVESEKPKREKENSPSSIIRFTGHNGDPIEWIIDEPHVLTLGTLRQRVSVEILGGRPTSTFALVVPYPPKRLQPSEDGATLASLNLQGKRALRIVLEGDWNTNAPTQSDPPVRTSSQPEWTSGGIRSLMSAAFSRMVAGNVVRPGSAGVSSSGSSAGGRSIGRVHSLSSSTGGGGTGRINTMSQILARQEEEEREMARHQAPTTKPNVYYGGNSTEYEGTPDDDKDNKSSERKKRQ